MLTTGQSSANSFGNFSEINQKQAEVKVIVSRTERGIYMIEREIEEHITRFSALLTLGGEHSPAERVERICRLQEFLANEGVELDVPILKDAVFADKKALKDSINAGLQQIINLKDEINQMEAFAKHTHDIFTDSVEVKSSMSEPARRNKQIGRTAVQAIGQWRLWKIITKAFRTETNTNFQKSEKLESILCNQPDAEAEQLARRQKNAQIARLTKAIGEMEEFYLNFEYMLVKKFNDRLARKLTVISVNAAKFDWISALPDHLYDASEKENIRQVLGHWRESLWRANRHSYHHFQLETEKHNFMKKDFSDYSNQADDENKPGYTPSGKYPH